MKKNHFHKSRSKILHQIIEGVEKERRAICSDRIIQRGLDNLDKWETWDKWENWDNWDNWFNWSNW